jgi:UDPglucose 6-dehydrogenase
MRHRIAVLGVGRIGVVTAIGLAHLGHHVVGIDRSASRISALQAGDLGEAEPGLRTALETARRHRSLRFGLSLDAQSYGHVFLCVDSPGGPHGEPDLTQVRAAAHDAARILAPHGILVTRSTVPVGTGDHIQRRLATDGRPDVRVVHMPEFLREGHAWEDFREPDRLVIGGDDDVAVGRTAGLFESIQCPVFRVSRRTAEFAKYAANAFLATSISFANELGDLCTDVGATSREVFDILRADRRIGPQAYLRPGLGFGGHCLPKDTEALQHLGDIHGRPLLQLQATRVVNSSRLGLADAWLRRTLGSLDGRTICIAGLAFKSGTDDLRESPSIALAHILSTQGALVTGWDPMVNNVVPGIDRFPAFEYALAGADALVIAHLPPAFGLEPGWVRATMTGNAIFDPSRLLDPAPWVTEGFAISTALSGTAMPAGGAV